MTGLDAGSGRRPVDCNRFDRKRFERYHFERWELVCYGVLLAWFAARVVFLALRLHPGIPPDEVTHLGRCLAYASVWGVPPDAADTFEYGLLSSRPWLYYWLMARALALNVFALPDLVFLRLVNGALGISTCAIAIAWMRQWCPNAIVRVLFAVCMTNTLMFTGLAGSVSYDNLANLLAVLALYFLTACRLRPSSAHLLSFLAVVLAGFLAKRTLLPLGFLGVAIFVVREHAQLRALPATLRRALEARERVPIALAALVFVLSVLAASLYGGNLVRYGKLQPGFDQVVGEQNAMQNRVFARSRILERFRAGEISGGEARQLARKIRHRGDRGDTLFLLKAALLPESRLIGPVAYAREWANRMLRSAVSYLGHRRATKGEPLVYGYFALFGLAAAMALTRRRALPARGVPTDLLVLAVGYSLILMWLVNYPNYTSSKYIELALQGRYVFPVLAPIYALVAWASIAPLPKRVQPWIAALVTAFYLYGDLPWMLTQTGPRWFI